MSNGTLRDRMLRREILAGTFLKTPAHEMVELLARSGLDFVAIDAEHAPFDRGRLDACLAMARALNFPVLVRVPEGSAAAILIALDSGATGVIVPHVDNVEKARNIVRWARFGKGGRGFAGSTRWAGFATRPMSEVLEQSVSETVVIAQIEEPEGVEAIDEIAAIDGLDGLFVGPADLAVCFGKTDINDPVIREAIGRVGKAARANKRCCITFAGNTDAVPALKDLGVTMFYIASEQAFMLNGAREVAAAVHAS